MNYFIILIFIAFLVGLYFYGNYGPSSTKCSEGFANNSGVRCPNLLIQKGPKYYLYNTKVAKVPGVNPIVFPNLEDYVEFMDWQRSEGIRCPVLYLQHSYDIQGDSVYKIRPDTTDPQGGLPPSLPHVNPNPTLLTDASHDDGQYNINSVPGYDQTSQYVGATTPLDAMNLQDENLLFNANPMADNWTGQKYTQALVDAGYYDDNQVSITVK